MKRQGFVAIFAFVFLFTLVSIAMAAPEAWVYEEPMGIRYDKDVGYGAETSFLTWHGYLNFEFDDAQGTHSNFDNHEFYLSTRATVSERVSVTAEFEYEHTPDKLITPIQAYGDYKFSDALVFRVGLFYTPMGLPRSYNLRGNKNRMIRQVALTHDIMFENWSEVGINVFGQLECGFFYDLAVGNGMPHTMKPGDSWFDSTGDLQTHTEDNNDDKAFHSRIGYHKTDLFGGEACVGFSYGTLKYDPDDEMELNFVGGDLRFLHGSGFRVQAEYMKRSGDDNPPDLANGISADAEGWYVLLSKRFVFEGKEFLHYIEPAFQVDSIDLDTHTDTNRDQVTYALGLIYSPEENYLLKFEYDFVDEVEGESIDNNKLWAAVVVEF
ncbi:MAG: hypothetical protein SWE60_02505 [Thermodesulfobacteriota bacterium]|nr:hypothetical protein [Thermodesulfobacteriota bacterium]